MNYENIKKRFINTEFNKNEDKHQDIICLSIDVKWSTKMLDELGQKTSLEIIKPFMRECAIIIKENLNIFENLIYAGDGINCVCYKNKENGIEDKIFYIATSINTLQNLYNSMINDWQKVKEWDFRVGIGIYSGNVICTKIKDMPQKFNNKLFVGDSVSKATKLCDESKEYIKNSIICNQEFYSYLSAGNREFFAKNGENYISPVFWKEYSEWKKHQN